MSKYTVLLSVKVPAVIYHIAPFLPSPLVYSATKKGTQTTSEGEAYPQSAKGEKMKPAPGAAYGSTGWLSTYQLHSSIPLGTTESWQEDANSSGKETASC